MRTWIDWATGEPREHEYRFENLDVLRELAQEEGLKVFLQVYMDSAPRWIGEKYPDSFFVSSNGAAVIPESAPGYCMDHPGVRQADLAFYAALAGHVRRNPAFVGWDLWSEPHVINWANPTYIRPRRPPPAAEPRISVPRALGRIYGYARQTARRLSQGRHSPKPYRQRCAVRVTYAGNRTSGQWKAHGRYLSRESARHRAAQREAGFDEAGEKLDVAQRLDEWQQDGDPRL